jgi:hypothetical protein
MKPLGSLIAVLLLVAVSLQAQKAEPPTSSDQAAKTFRLDPRWPFVYLKFDHIGTGERVNDQQPTTRIWLHLINNCRLPLVVRGGQPVDGGLPGEVFIDNVVRLNPPINGIASFSTEIEPDHPPIATLTEPGQPPNQKRPANDRPANSKARAKPVEDDEAFMPLGYPSFDVVSTETILPGGEVLFSVPVNFVTRKWHFEISFDLGSEQPDERIPEELAFVDPYVRGHVEMVLSYGFYDLPKEHRDEVEKLNRDLQKKP